MSENIAATKKQMAPTHETTGVSPLTTIRHSIDIYTHRISSKDLKPLASPIAESKVVQKLKTARGLLGEAARSLPASGEIRDKITGLLTRHVEGSIRSKSGQVDHDIEAEGRYARAGLGEWKNVPEAQKAPEIIRQTALDKCQTRVELPLTVVDADYLRDQAMRPVSSPAELAEKNSRLYQAIIDEGLAFDVVDNAIRVIPCDVQALDALLRDSLVEVSLTDLLSPDTQQQTFNGIDLLPDISAQLPSQIERRDALRNRLVNAFLDERTGGEASRLARYVDQARPGGRIEGEYVLARLGSGVGVELRFAQKDHTKSLRGARFIMTPAATQKAGEDLVKEGPTK